MTLDRAGALPKARVENLVVTELGQELLVYDTLSHQLHQLNPLAATVWRSLDGMRNAADVLVLARAEVGPVVTADSLRIALTMLSEASLLDSTVEIESLPVNQSRRRFLKKAGLAGIAVPVIASVTAPLAAANASTRAQSIEELCAIDGYTLDSGNRQCYSPGSVCCNNMGNCGTESDGATPRHVPCNTCQFWQWNIKDTAYYVEPYAYGSSNMVMQNGRAIGPVSEHPDKIEPWFQCR